MKYLCGNKGAIDGKKHDTVCVEKVKLYEERWQRFPLEFHAN